jgi:hypothetical protein
VAFDTKASSQVSESESTDGKGYSKNTIRALGIIRKDLEPVEGEEKVMSFKYMATKVRFFNCPVVRILIASWAAGDSPRCGSILFRAPRPGYARLRSTVSTVAV